MTVSLAPVIQTNFTKSFPEWKPATWEDYLSYRDDEAKDCLRLFYYQGKIFVEMGTEGINHAGVSDLFTMLFALWFMQKPDIIFSSLGRCLPEKPTIKRAAAPDLVLYIGEDYPRWQEGKRRYIDLDKSRVPNLVGEIADTTLATDMDEKKHLYAELGIPEYWIIDVRGFRVFTFLLTENGTYQESAVSLGLENLPIALLEQTLEKLNGGTNGSAALWFSQQIAGLKAE